MRQRCHSPTSSGYHKYGARGIRVCERWRSSFANFLADMGECPEGMTLGRIKNDGGYAAENCRWETPTEQANNRRSSKFLTYNGETMTCAQWSRRSGIRQQEIYRRIQANWPVERILETPVRHR